MLVLGCNETLALHSFVGAKGFILAGAIKEQWGSRIGVILAVAGSAVGLGNFLRFPGQAAQNGGGAFLLPYFISLLILGIPLCWAEWTMGRYGGQRGFNSAPGIFSIIWRNPLSKYLSVFAVMIPLVVYMYYVVIEAWCLGYAFHYLRGDLALGSDPEKYNLFFKKFCGASEDGALFTANRELLVFVAITFTINFFLIYRGVAKGIESFCKYAIPVMAICAFCVLIRVLTLSGGERSVSQGLGFMWNPDITKLKDTQTWIAAAGQIFFSLSVGFGVIINYASYLTKKDDVVLSGLTASSMNEFFEVCLGGLITLPAAFIFLGATAATFTTFSLGFNALPNVFAQMPMGQAFGFLWFFMLFLAAITSSLSMLQPVIAFLEEGLGLQRKGSSLFLMILTIAGTGFVLYFSSGTAMDTFDFWVGTVFIYVLAMVQAFIYGWIFGIERGDREAHVGAHIRIPKFVQLLLKYVVPIYLMLLFAAFCYENLPSRVLSPTKAEETAKVWGLLSSEGVMWAGADPANVPEELGAFDSDGKWRSDKGYTFDEGKVGEMLSDKVIQYSFAFLGTVLILLLFIIYLAGRRWERLGLLDVAESQ